MHLFTAPETLPETLPGSASVFLAGSIEMGTAVEWQQRVLSELEAAGADELCVLNPRRAAWDASWPQDPAFEPFREQVEWELDALDRASHAFFYFDPETKSPITLMELGLTIGKKPVTVVCPPAFWRYGNVAIVCARHAEPTWSGLETGLEQLLRRFGR